MIEKKPTLAGIWLGEIMDLTDIWFFWIFWVEIGVFIYKGCVLPYAKPYFGIEFTFYIVWGLTTIFRSSLGDHGLSRCDPLALVFYLIVTLFTTLCCNLYFVHYQAFILRIDLIFNAFCMGIECLEFLLAAICAIIFFVRERL